MVQPYVLKIYVKTSLHVSSVRSVPLWLEKKTKIGTRNFKVAAVL